MRARLWVGGAAIAATATAACLTIQLPGAGGEGDGGAGVDAAGTSLGGGPDGSNPDGCASHGGPAMVQVDTFCIDATEVTNAQYAKFLSAGWDTSKQPASCGWNKSFAPDCVSDNGADDAPQGCVDWCDAYAFCQWAGKRLCGKIGGGAIDPSFENVAAIDQWFRACSHGGARTYPYGSTYQRGACNDVATDAGRPVATGSLSACGGGYPGLFDMSGNLEEWEDACSPKDGGDGSHDSCIARGGSYENGDPQCALSYSDNWRQTAQSFRGFRCCSP